MTPGARLAAAIEVLERVLGEGAAADRVLAAWGKSHRFAGSKDRAAIADRVYAVLRHLNACAQAMGSRSPRALVIGSLKVVDGLDVVAIAALVVDGTHAPGALNADERLVLEGPGGAGDDAARLNYPAWLKDDLVAAFGASLPAEMAALNTRAPLDLRVNLLKAGRDAVMQELQAAGFAVERCKRAATGVRLPAGADARLGALACHAEGRVEVQDESSQLAVELAAVQPGELVIDLAAGGGGKTLALAAALDNTGRVIACDVDARRLMQIEPRVARSGATNILANGDPYAASIAALAGAGADLVFVDAPCSGSGTWRRNPEARWTLTPAKLEGYMSAQVRLLDRAAELVHAKGRILHAVCSVLPREGMQQAEAFCARHPGWKVARTLALSPARDGTDGFFAALLVRA